jgi:hypothetical protein
VTLKRGDEGFAGGVEGLVFGMLLFVVGTLIVANAWGVVDTKLAVDTAARQAARAYVQSNSSTSALLDARQAAADALAGYGRSPRHAVVTFTGDAFGRCARVTAVVVYPAPLLVLPFVGRLGPGESVTAHHSELVDPFRSGLPGAARCG